MPLDALKSAVLDANLDTVRHGLVKATFGNASGIDRATGRIVIKPSGVPYPDMTTEHMVLTDLDGAPLDNRFHPSSDLDTHVALYHAFPQIGGIVHTHSTYATIMAQARRPIPPMGTTHADYFRGTIPVTRDLTTDEITTRYVAATGAVIAEAVDERDPLAIPAALVAGHGPFVWGRDPAEAVLNAMILEEVAKMAWHGALLDARPPLISDTLLDHHFLRKHGANATYGQ